MALLPPDGPLGDGRVVLRPIEQRDIETVSRAAGDPEIARRFGLQRMSAREYVDGYVKAFRAGNAAAFAICGPGDDGDGQVLIELQEAGRAEVGYWLLREARGRGLATAALRLLSRWALAQPGIARLQLWTVPENTASQRVAERAGYQREGVLRSYGEVEGRRVDAVFYSLLATDL